MAKKRGWLFTVATKDGSAAPGGPLLNPTGKPTTTINTWSRAENRDRKWRAEVLGDLDVTIRRAPRRRTGR
jgi:hypothetical protein